MNIRLKQLLWSNLGLLQSMISLGDCAKLLNFDRDWCWWWYLMENFTQYMKKGRGLLGLVPQKLKKQVTSTRYIFCLIRPFSRVQIDTQYWLVFSLFVERDRVTPSTFSYISFCETTSDNLFCYFIIFHLAPSPLSLQVAKQLHIKRGTLLYTT